MKSEELIEVAKLGRAVGLKGFLKLHDLSDFPEQFKPKAVFSTDKNENLTILEFDKAKGLVRFLGIDGRDNASKLTNRLLKTTKESTRANCALKEGEFFWFDIIGCKVVEQSKILGLVDEIERIGAQDYLSVKTDAVLVNEGFQKSFLIPYVDRYIVSTDIDAKEITASGAIDFLEQK